MVLCVVLLIELLPTHLGFGVVRQSMVSGEVDRVSPTAANCIPIVVAVALWGQGWTRQRILCYCDNQSAVVIIRSHYSRHPLMASLLRCLFFFEPKYNCTLTATHIPGVLNDRAEHLSRNQSHLFLSKMAEANPSTTSVPLPLIFFLYSFSWDTQLTRKSPIALAECSKRE